MSRVRFFLPGGVEPRITMSRKRQLRVGGDEAGQGLLGMNSRLCVRLLRLLGSRPDRPTESRCEMIEWWQAMLGIIGGLAIPPFAHDQARTHAMAMLARNVYIVAVEHPIIGI